MVFLTSCYLFSDAQTDMVKIWGGSYVPLYGDSDFPIKVDNFMIDIYPVTNKEYGQFIKTHPEWGKKNILALYADGGYLQQFEDDGTLITKESANLPATTVSYFAAKAYCSSVGKRLPTTDEWEFVAMADETTQDARKKKDYNQYILNWYSRPARFNNPVGSTFKNVWGVWDLHGLVWEWTSDYNSVLMNNEARVTGSTDTNLFCGGASVGATDLENYAAFMRYAFRSSLKSNYTVRNLGFRCAKDAD